jgi:acyl-CoA synthetase (AMP-forming)/AMP-acid ligase II
MDPLDFADVGAALRHTASSGPERIAVTIAEDGTRWSYGRLDLEARRIAARLKARHAPGDRVPLPSSTGFEFVAAFVGCLYAGMVAAPADAGSWVAPERVRDRPAVLQHTSGATGEPKAVLLSHRNLLHNVDAQRRAFGLTAETRVGGWLPLHHSLGLFGLVLPALVLGGGCVLMRPGTFLRDPGRWLRMIDEYDVAVSAAPNFAYEMARARVTDEQLAQLDLSRWRVAVAGAEKVDASTLAGFAKRFAPAGLRGDALRAGYGLAEATLFVSTGALVTRVDTAALEQRRFVPAGSGTAFVSYGVPTGYDVAVTDPDTGAVRPPGAVGEIRLRGPSVAAGCLSDGYLRTGDLGTLHDGELYVVGRVAEAMSVDGRELFPQDIERTLRERHRDRLGLIGAVFTLPATGLVVTHEVKGRPAPDRMRALAGDLRRTVEREFGITVAGVALFRGGAVPRTPSGKIRRVALRERALTGDLRAWFADFR